MFPTRAAFTLLLAWLLCGPITAVASNAYGAAAAGEIVLGVFPRRNATVTTRMFTPLAEYLSERLGRRVRLDTAKDFESFWNNVEAGNYHIVHYNQYHYLKSSRDYQVFASNEEFGKSKIRGALFVRADSDIDTVEKLRGRKIIFGGGPGAMMSHIVPRHLLLQAGLQAGDYEESYASNPPNSMMAVYFRQSDAAGAGDIVTTLPVVTRRIDTGAIRMLAVSEPLSHLPWSMKRDLPFRLRDRLQALFLSLNDHEEGRQVLKAAQLTALHPADDRDYEQHRRIISAVTGERLP